MNRCLLPQLFSRRVLAATTGLLITAQMVAQPFTVLHTFKKYRDGSAPYEGLVLSDNILYGATSGGGQTGSGTIFAINTNGSGFTNLYVFTQTAWVNNEWVNSDGTGPGALNLSGNTLYGGTGYGGPWGGGTIFVVNTDGSGFRNLHSFTRGSDGNNLLCLRLSGSTLYGTTLFNGLGGADGALFKLNIDGSGFTNIPVASADEIWWGSLTLFSNTVYGSSGSGGNGVSGFIFAFNSDGTGFTNIHSFDGADGAVPVHGVTVSGGILYGTTIDGPLLPGGIEGNGTVFKVNMDGTGFTNLYVFTKTSGSGDGYDGGTNLDGAKPYGGVILAGNILYGTAEWGGTSGNGTVFAVNTDGTGFTNLYNFSMTSTNLSGDYTNSDGAHPYAGLILSGNTLYGTAYQGGLFNDGTVFSIILPTVGVPQPQLTSRHSGNQVILTWPTNFAGFMLQSSTNLASPVWTTNSPAPVVVNGQNTVTNPISGTQQFFRLSQ